MANRGEEFWPAWLKVEWQFPYIVNLLEPNALHGTGFQAQEEPQDPLGMMEP